jgi:ABC-2 type transport system ATP-binding protein
MTVAAIDVRDLWMRYGDNEVLRGIDLQARRGEVVALLGPNGAGKTTTIEILEGFRRPASGHVRVLGEDPRSAGDAWRARIGIVLQSWRDHGKWRVGELLTNLGRFYAPHTRPDRARPVPVDELLEMVGLTAQRDQRIASLSGGQRRRLDVAIGIVGRPELLFLDEPTAGFDPQARRDFHELVHDLADLSGTTILLTTHDLAEAEKLADRILILNQGRIVASGTPDELAREVADSSEVRWREDGAWHVHATADVAEFVRGLFARADERIEDLEVRRASLEDTYLEMVRRNEVAAPPPLTLTEEVPA